jgi:hypothetical protein
MQYGMAVSNQNKEVKGDKELQDLSRIAKNGEQYLMKMKSLAGSTSSTKETPTIYDRV